MKLTSITHKDKLALAQRCLSAAHAIDPSNPTVHVQALRLRKALDTPAEPLPPQVSEPVNAELETILPKSQNPEEWNNSFLAANKTSVPHIQAALSCRQLLNANKKSQNEKELTTSLDAGEVSIETALVGLELLNEWESDQDVKAAYAAKAKKNWPESSAFDLN